MDASKYPVTFGYGAKDGYWYGPNGIIGPYHRGDDRACPSGTPLIVNGITIGLTGNTGASSGPHLHIGKFINGIDVNPQGGGFSFSNAVVYSTGQDKTMGKYIKLQADGALFVYMHLSQINVNQGQVLGSAPTIKGDQPMTPDQERNAYRIVLGREMEHGGTGRTGYRFITDGEAEVNVTRQNYINTINQLQSQLASVQQALANEQSKPPKEVIKEVEKIVKEEVVVEKVVEVEKKLNLKTAIIYIVELIKSKLRRN